MVELYNPSLNVIYRALPVQKVRARALTIQMKGFWYLQHLKQTQEPYVAVALLSVPETYVLARIFSAGCQAGLLQKPQASLIVNTSSRLVAKRLLDNEKPIP